MTRLTVDAALELIRGSAPTMESETIDAAAALGRTIAAPVVAKNNVPSFRASAMDGFAVRSKDLGSGPVTLDTGCIYAGDVPPALPLGHAIAIATGAPVPTGADRVIARERARIEQGKLRTELGDCSANVRAIGEDMARDMVIVAPGSIVTPDVIGAMVACGADQIEVRRKPVVATFSTGAELLGGAGASGIADSNGPMIAAALSALDLPTLALGSIGDDDSALDTVLNRATADVVISTGGVSVGERDLVRVALERRGAEIVFHGIAMRPGKPILFAILPDGRLFFGLPGNPVAALIGFRFFVTAAIRAMLGLPDEVGNAVASDHPGRDGITLFLRGKRRMVSGDGIIVETDLDQRSHILSAVAAADCWLRVDRRDGAPQHRVFAKTAVFR